MAVASNGGPRNYDASKVAQAMENISDALERVAASVATLKDVLAQDEVIDLTVLAPADPANKYEVGGLLKLSPRGVEVCYRLLDSGKSRYAVANLMDVSFGAISHRYSVWKKLGGVNRTKRPLS